jgi:hypothetical protein
LEIETMCPDDDNKLPMVDDTRLVSIAGAVELIREVTGVEIPKSRIHKDSASGVAPRPDAIYGRTFLYRPSKILVYAKKLIRWLPPEEAA